MTHSISTVRHHPAHRVRGALLGGISAIAIAATAAPAMAQDFVLEEILVTAQKREQSLQDVSTAVTALSGDTILNSQVHDLQDLRNLAPSVTFGDDFNMAKIFVRGVGANTSTTGSETGVAFHVDGVFVARAEAQLTSLFDVERVEVVRGPQGTLYGRNAVGGSINVITRKPTPEWEGYGRFTFGNYKNVVAEAGVGGPISDKLLTRLAFKVHDRAGFGENPVTGSEVNNRNRQMARIQFTYLPTNDFDIRLAAEWFNQDDASGALKFRRESFIGDTFDPSLAATGGPDFPGNNGVGGFASDPRDLASEFDPNTKKETWAVTAEMNWQATDRLSLTNITSYRDFETAITQDLDVSAVINSLDTNGGPTSVQRRDVRSEQFSNELRANFINEWLDGVLGFFFFTENQRPVDTVGLTPFFGQEQNLGVLTNPATATPPLIIRNGNPPLTPASEGFGPIDLGFVHDLCQSQGLVDSIQGRDTIPPKRVCIESDLDTTAFAVFGQARITLGHFVEGLENFTLKVGGRFSHENRKTDNPTVILGGGGLGPIVVSDPGHPFSSNERNFDDFTPEIGLEWQATPNLLAYYTYSEGFKAGAGENGAQSSVIVDPETIENHEIGIKSTLFRGRMTMNLSAFTYDLNGLQINKTVAGGPAGFGTIFENAAATTAEGVEFEISAQPMRNFRFNGSVSYLDSEFKDFETIDPLDPVNLTIPGNPFFIADPDNNGEAGRQINLAGNPTRNSPKWAAQLHAEYDIPGLNLPHQGVLTLAGDMAYKGDIFFTEFARLLEGSDSYTMFDAALTYRDGTGNFSASFWVENLTDKLVASSTFALSTARTIGVTYLPPRTYGFSVGYNF